MNIKFFNFSKRMNSTATPVLTDYVANKTVRLKEPTSEHDPVVLLAETLNTSYTYAYISAFGKYYFVRDIVAVGAYLTEYHLTEDVLATFKGDISSSSFRLLYGPTSIQNKMLTDSRIQMQNSRVQDIFGGQSSDYQVFNASSSSQNYVLTVFNGQPYDSCGVGTSYLLTSANMATLKAWLCDPSITADLDRLLFGNPLNALFSCRWIPYDISSSDLVSTSGIYIGENACIMNCHIIKNFPIIEKEIDIEFSTRYNTVSGSNVIKDFRAYPPYTIGSLFLPGIGSVEINMADFSYIRKVIIRVSIEAITGNVRYELYNKLLTMAPIQTFECNVASVCPLGQMTGDLPGIISGMITTSGSTATLFGASAAALFGSGNIAPIALSGGAVIAGAANTILSSMKRSTSVVGNIGGRTIQLFPYIALVITTIDTEDPYESGYISLQGTPTSGVHSISSLSGYIQCVNASISCSGTALEKEEINAFLNSGFYYE